MKCLQLSLLGVVGCGHAMLERISVTAGLCTVAAGVKQCMKSGPSSARMYDCMLVVYLVLNFCPDMRRHIVALARMCRTLCRQRMT